MFGKYCMRARDATGIFSKSPQLKQLAASFASVHHHLPFDPHIPWSLHPGLGPRRGQMCRGSQAYYNIHLRHPADLHGLLLHQNSRLGQPPIDLLCPSTQVEARNNVNRSTAVRSTPGDIRSASLPLQPALLSLTHALGFHAFPCLCALCVLCSLPARPSLPGKLCSFPSGPHRRPPL